ncbi:MAG: PspC domain-containing protein [Candidatus Aenigmatarchaeota archaeon]
MKKLYRSTSNKMLGGVCGGIGEYLDVDPTIVRILWVLFGLTGFGVLAYIAAWIIVPKKN